MAEKKERKSNKNVKPRDAYGDVHGWFNPKYSPEICRGVPELYKNGESDIEVASALDIHLSTFYEWIKKHPEFKQAVLHGRQYSESWWMRLGRDGAAGVVKANASLWFGNMKNRFKWRDAVTLDLTGDSEEVKQLKSIVGRIKKYQKDA